LTNLIENKSRRQELVVVSFQLNEIVDFKYVLERDSHENKAIISLS